MLSGSADTEDATIVVHDYLRQQVRDNTAARTNVTVGYLLDEWCLDIRLRRRLATATGS